MKVETGTVTIDGTRYRVAASGRVTCGNDFWWPEHPWAKEVRRVLSKRRDNRLLAKMAKELSGSGPRSAKAQA